MKTCLLHEGGERLLMQKNLQVCKHNNSEQMESIANVRKTQKATQKSQGYMWARGCGCGQRSPGKTGQAGSICLVCQATEFGADSALAGAIRGFQAGGSHDHDSIEVMMT